MVFSSLLFMFRFLPILLLLYFIAPKKLKNGLLFLASLVFYAWGEPVYVVLMIFSTLVDFFHGNRVEKCIEEGNKKKAKKYVISSVIINLCLLGFFKYTDFILTNINSIFGADIPLLKLPLPIGISFYTFQTMSYTIDIYRGEAKAQKNIISFGAYVAMFPQLIAGPIVRYQTIAEELVDRKVTQDGFADGIMRFMTGLGKKVLLANNIGMLWNTISASNMAEVSVLTAWLGAVCYAFQIYFDFSGYSDMAIGLGRMLGFHFPENFLHPYESRSITEFWRRWHVTLGTWFREYVYIPLGGNRKGIKRHFFNIFVVWCLTGIWHGASWNFGLWGLYFAIILVAEKLFLLKVLAKIPRVFSHIYTLLLVLISWVIFAFDNLTSGLHYLKAMFGGYGNVFVNNNFLYQISNHWVILLILIIGATSIPVWLVKKWKLERFTILKLIFIVVIFLLSVAYLVDASYNPFLYFRF